jgi:hypothetical protein
MATVSETAMAHAIPSSVQRRNFRQRLAILGPSSIPSRGKRFLKRKRPADTDLQSATLADLARLPDWIMLDEDQVGEIASVATLMHFRRQLDTIVDGERVRHICEMFGEEYFDMVCDAPIPGEEMLAAAGDPLPPLDHLRDFGQRLLIKALPSIMSDRFAEASGDPNFLILANHAAKMVTSHARSLQRDDLP